MCLRLQLTVHDMWQTIGHLNESELQKLLDRIRPSLITLRNDVDTVLTLQAQCIPHVAPKKIVRSQTMYQYVTIRVLHGRTRQSVGFLHQKSSL